jgi:hypothetical protein
MLNMAFTSVVMLPYDLAKSGPAQAQPEISEDIHRIRERAAEMNSHDRQPEKQNEAQKDATEHGKRAEEELKEIEEARDAFELMEEAEKHREEAASVDEQAHATVAELNLEDPHSSGPKAGEQSLDEFDSVEIGGKQVDADIDAIKEQYKALDEKQKAERIQEAKDIADGRDRLMKRHDELNTDPAFVQGFLDRYDETAEAMQTATAQRHAQQQEALQQQLREQQLQAQQLQAQQLEAQRLRSMQNSPSL